MNFLSQFSLNFIHSNYPFLNAVTTLNTAQQFCNSLFISFQTLWRLLVWVGLQFFIGCICCSCRHRDSYILQWWGLGPSHRIHSNLQMQVKELINANICRTSAYRSLEELSCDSGLCGSHACQLTTGFQFPLPIIQCTNCSTIITINHPGLVQKKKKKNKLRGP
jgi:hypothetical protein